MVATWSLIALSFLPAFQAAQEKPGVPAPAVEDPSSKPPLPSADLTPEKRGDIYMARKMHKEAIQAYMQGPKNAVLMNKIGIAYHQMQDLDQAKRYYERAIKLNKKYAEAINNLGTIYYHRKSYRRATSQYQKALKITPDSASIYSNLGTAYFARKDYKAASEAYQQALKLDPEVFEHRSTFGVLLQQQTVDDRAKFHYYLARTYAQAGMNERALLYIRKSLEEGFKDRKKYLEEPEFAGLRELPEFQQLMAAEPRVL